MSVLSSPKQIESGEKREDLGIGEKRELIKKLELGASVDRVCDEHGVKKNTVSVIRRSKDELTRYAMNLDIATSNERKVAVHKRKHKCS